MTEPFLFSVLKSKWTDDELRILTKNCSKGLDVLNELLPQRTENGITSKATRMGIWLRTWEKPKIPLPPLFMENDQNKERLQYRIQQLQYLAGYFDGEDCVCISKQKSKKNRKSPCYSLIIGVASTDRIVIEDLYHFFGVGWTCFGLLHKNFKVSNRIFRFSWQVQGDRAVQVLALLLPFLRLKRKQTMLAIEFQEKRIIRSRELTEDDLALRENYRQKMSCLNRSPKL